MATTEAGSIPPSESSLPANENSQNGGHQKKSVADSLRKQSISKLDKSETKSPSPKRAISIRGFNAAETDARPVNTPTSIEACKRVGVLPEELVKRDPSAYKVVGMDKEGLNLKYQLVEKLRAEKLKEVEKVHSKLSNTQLHLKQNAKKSKVGDVIEQEVEKIEKYQEKRKAEVAKIIMQEMQRQSREQEILQRLEDREKELHATREAHRAQQELKYAQHRSKVEMRLNQAVEQQQRMKEEQLREYELKHQQFEEKQIAFEQKREEKIKQNHAKAVEKFQTIQKKQEKMRELEEHKRDSNMEKEKQAQERLRQIKEEREREENRKHDLQMERQIKRQQQQEDLRKEEQRRIDEMLLRQQKEDEALQEALRERKGDIARKALAQKPATEEKMDRMERARRVELFNQEQTMKRLENSMERVDHMRHDKEELLNRRQHMRAEHQHQKLIVNDYLYKLKTQDKKAKIPEFLDFERYSGQDANGRKSSLANNLNHTLSHTELPKRSKSVMENTVKRPQAPLPALLKHNPL